jgi:DNA invertase Pin-like site-specific DNA recombinase
MNTSRAALYVRVSTVDQSNDGQEADLLEYLERRGWQLFGIYRDTISGTTSSRPGLDLLLKDARARKFEAVVTVRLDRLGRSLIQLSLFAGELLRLKIALICTEQGIDTSSDNPAGVFQLQVLAAVAEFERQLISDRTKAGLRVARARGRHPGRKPFGLEVRAAAVEMRAAGKSIRQISRALKISTGSVASFTAAPRTCRKCGCTDQNCQQCVERTGAPCYWVDLDLCSACSQPAEEYPAGAARKLPAEPLWAWPPK